MDWIVFVVLAAVSFVVPVLLRQAMAFVQAGAALVGLVLYLAGQVSDQWLLLVIFWVFGSLCGIGMRVEEAAREASASHAKEFHGRD